MITGLKRVLPRRFPEWHVFLFFLDNQGVNDYKSSKSVGIENAGMEIVKR